MDSETTGREKTYLVLLSFLIIANMFIPIAFDKVNILGNEAIVSDKFIELTVVIVWLYFLWIFYQSNGWKFEGRYKSKIYTNVLQKLASDKIHEHAKKEGLYKSKEEIARIDESSLKNELTFHGCQHTEHGYKITEESNDNFGNTTLIELNIPFREIRFPMLVANTAYILKDPDFSKYTFPYVISAIAFFAIIYQLIW